MARLDVLAVISFRMKVGEDNVKDGHQLKGNFGILDFWQANPSLGTNGISCLR